MTISSSAAATETSVACANAAESAQANRASGRLTTARANLLECVREQCPPFIRSDCVTWLREVGSSLPSIVVRARDPDGHDLLETRVLLDGALVRKRLDGIPIELDPGEHSLRIEADGYSPLNQKILATQGEKERLIAIQLAPAFLDSEASKRRVADEPASTPKSAPSTPSLLPYGLAAAGGAALGVFTYFEISAHSDLNDLRDGCGRTSSCLDADVDAVRTKFIAAGVSLGLGVALLGVAVFVGLTQESKSAGSSRAMRQSGAPFTIHF